MTTKVPRSGFPPWVALGRVRHVRQAAVRRGRAKRPDHARLVHLQWLEAARLGMDMYVVRVSSADNIADIPSREVRPCFHSLYARLRSARDCLLFLSLAGNNAVAHEAYRGTACASMFLAGEP